MRELDGSVCASTSECVQGVCVCGLRRYRRRCPTDYIPLSRVSVLSLLRLISPLSHSRGDVPRSTRVVLLPRTHVPHTRVSFPPDPFLFLPRVNITLSSPHRLLHPSRSLISLRLPPLRCLLSWQPGYAHTHTWTRVAPGRSVSRDFGFDTLEREANERLIRGISSRLPKV